MKNIYKITKGQLITLWVFGLIGWLVAVSEAEYSGLATFFSVLIPMLLIFYTIGWRALNKTKEASSKQGFQISNLLPTKKTLILSVVIGMIICSIIFAISYVIKIRNENLEKEQLKQKYSQVILEIDSLREEVASCVKPVTDKKYQEEVRSCNLLKNKVKHDYNFCVSLTPVTSPASCLYDHDYESIDCSQETLEKKSRLKVTESDVPLLCRLQVNELKEANSIIEEYSKLEK